METGQSKLSGRSPREKLTLRDLCKEGTYKQGTCKKARGQVLQSNIPKIKRRGTYIQDVLETACILETRASAKYLFDLQVLLIYRLRLF
jgi:hypothetical protein